MAQDEADVSPWSARAGRQLRWADRMLWSTLALIAVAASPGAKEATGIWGTVMMAGTLCLLFAFNAAFCAFMSMRRGE
jgi:hypothetical protein